MNLSDADWERLERYAGHRGTPEELAETERWVNASDELRAIVRGMRTAGLPPSSEEPQWNEEVAWHRVSRRLRWFSRPSLVSASAARRSIERWTAAAVILVVAIPSVVIALRHRSAPVAPPAAPAPAPARELASRRGERAAFDLPDGTRVMLGVDSRIRVPADYGRRSRLVYLEGEAYFEVRHDDERPFLVYAANAVTEDLGTAFVMRAYPGDTVARVVVTEGKVALRPTGAPAGSGTMLSPGDLGRLSRAGVASVTSGVDVSRYLAWTRGRLEFANQPLREVIPALERWYDLSIQFDDSALGAVPVTVSFERESADEAIRALARLLDVRYQQRERVVQLFVSKSR